MACYGQDADNHDDRSAYERLVTASNVSLPTGIASLAFSNG